MKILGMGVPEFVMMLIIVGPIIAGIAIARYVEKRDKAAAAGSLPDMVVRGEGAGQAAQVAVAAPAEARAASASDQALDMQRERFLAGHPALRRWKTSVGLSFLGVLISWLGRTLLVMAATAMGLVIVSLVPGLYGGDYFVRIVAVAAVAMPSVCGIAYALLVYPSYFTDLPLLESPLVISMFNLLFGGILFGALWNSCLTISRNEARRKRGVSYIVYALFEGQAVLMQFMGCMYFATLFATANVPVA